MRLSVPDGKASTGLIGNIYCIIYQTLKLISWKNNLHHWNVLLKPSKQHVYHHNSTSCPEAMKLWNWWKLLMSAIFGVVNILRVQAKMTLLDIWVIWIFKKTSSCLFLKLDQAGLLVVYLISYIVYLITPSWWEEQKLNDK